MRMILVPALLGIHVRMAAFARTQDSVILVDVQMDSVARIAKKWQILVILNRVSMEGLARRRLKRKAKNGKNKLGKIRSIGT